MELLVVLALSRRWPSSGRGSAWTTASLEGGHRPTPPTRSGPTRPTPPITPSHPASQVAMTTQNANPGTKRRIRTSAATLVTMPNTTIGPPLKPTHPCRAAATDGLSENPMTTTDNRLPAPTTGHTPRGLLGLTVLSPNAAPLRNTRRGISEPADTPRFSAGRLPAGHHPGTGVNGRAALTRVTAPATVAAMWVASMAIVAPTRGP